MMRMESFSKYCADWRFPAPLYFSSSELVAEQNAIQSSCSHWDGAEFGLEAKCFRLICRGNRAFSFYIDGLHERMRSSWRVRGWQHSTPKKETCGSRLSISTAMTAQSFGRF